MDSRLPILLCFDVEPDDKVVETEADWAGVRPLVELLTRYRVRFEAATGVPAHFSWFLRMDPQVRELHGSETWAVTAFERELQLLHDAKDEIGLHVHSWTRTPRGWVSEFSDPSWIEHCVRSSFEAYERCFGKACRSFRFGDRWMDQQTMLLLESLKVRFDLTLEPGQTGFPVPAYMEELMQGGCVDYRDVPRRPYHPSSSDYRKPGRWPRSLRLKEIPMSTAPAESALASMGTLYLAADGASVCNFFDRLLADNTTRHLALPARTDIAVRPGERRNLEMILEHIANHPERQRLRLATPSEV